MSKSNKFQLAIIMISDTQWFLNVSVKNLRFMYRMGKTTKHRETITGENVIHNLASPVLD